MSDNLLYPLTFTPVFKDYPWGGQNLATKLGRTIPDGIVAESWDIAAHPHGSSTVNNGPLAGLTLPQVQEKLGMALLGENNEEALESGKFPLLIKILDASRWLSIQVHPDDDYAQEHEQGELGKTEMWVILHAEPGAELIYGFEPGVTPARLEQAIKDETVAQLLHHLPVQPGDVIFIPAGTIHALGGGIIIAEVQQNSDTTYRIFDWGRPRPLHIPQALAVLNFEQVAPSALQPVVLMDEEGLRVEQIGACDYFETERVTMPAGSLYVGLCDGETFEIWGVIQGSATIEWGAESLTLNAVNWMLLPAELGEFQVVAEEESVLLRVFVP